MRERTGIGGGSPRGRALSHSWLPTGGAAQNFTPRRSRSSRTLSIPRRLMILMPLALIRSFTQRFRRGRPETLILQIWVKKSAGLIVCMRDIVARHGAFSGDDAYTCHRELSCLSPQPRRLNSVSTGGESRLGLSNPTALIREYHSPGLGDSGMQPVTGFLSVAWPNAEA